MNAKAKAMLLSRCLETCRRIINVEMADATQPERRRETRKLALLHIKQIYRALAEESKNPSYVIGDTVLIWYPTRIGFPSQEMVFTLWPDGWRIQPKRNSDIGK